MRCFSCDFENSAGKKFCMRERGQPPLSVRVGVNSGEVVVRSIQTSDAHTEYTPIGHSISLAARLQTLAAPASLRRQPPLLLCQAQRERESSSKRRKRRGVERNSRVASSLSCSASKLNVEVTDPTYLPADAALKNLEEAGDNILLVVAAEHRR
jgi:hypothetical protein